MLLPCCINAFLTPLWCSMLFPAILLLFYCYSIVFYILHCKSLGERG